VVPEEGPHENEGGLKRSIVNVSLLNIQKLICILVKDLFIFCSHLISDSIFVKN
jgi:hypothetical protein